MTETRGDMEVREKKATISTTQAFAFRLSSRPLQTLYLVAGVTMLALCVLKPAEALFCPPRSQTSTFLAVLPTPVRVSIPGQHFLLETPASSSLLAVPAVCSLQFSP